MIKAAERFGRTTERRLRELIKRFEDEAGGLGDPLSFSMDWLERSHEPAYSRWLAWVLQQLDEPAAICRVLGLKDMSPSGKVQTKAEVRLSSGDRLDVVIYCGGVETVVVETKLGRHREAELSDQLSRYGKQLCAWHAKGVLVLVGADDEKYAGFQVRRWADFCIALRRELPYLVKRNPRVVCAMMLGFVGAVEQNLLGFPSLESGDSPQLYPRCVRHLKACFEGGM